VLFAGKTIPHHAIVVLEKNGLVLLVSTCGARPTSAYSLGVTTHALMRSALVLVAISPSHAGSPCARRHIHIRLCSNQYKHAVLTE
jgi:hypothetical protein